MSKTPSPSTHELTRIALGDALSVLLDHRGRTPKKLGGDFTDTGVPVISAKCIRNGRVTDEDRRFVSHEMFAKWMPESLEAGDVLVTSEAPLGEVARWSDDGAVCLGQRLFALRADPAVVDQRFLYYLLRSREVQVQLHSRATGTTAQGIRQSQLVRVALAVPPMEAQRDVSGFLGGLDDKIDVNRRISETLEEIARALFTSWFVDFDPVRGTASVPEDIRRFFPDRLVDSQIGPVPEGWEVASLGEHVQLGRDLVDPRKDPEGWFDHFSLPAFDDGGVARRERGTTIRSAKTLVPPDSLLLSKLNPRIPRLWWPPGEKECPAIASTEFLVLTAKESLTREYLYGVLSSGSLRRRMMGLARGTSGSHQRVSPADLLDTALLLPPRKFIQLFTQYTQPMFEQRLALAGESETLAHLRDTLLPRLISGEIRLDAHPRGPSSTSIDP